MDEPSYNGGHPFDPMGIADKYDEDDVSISIKPSNISLIHLDGYLNRDFVHVFPTFDRYIFRPFPS